MKILIANDEMMSRRLLQETLVRAGYEVTAVENGRRAVEHLCPVDGSRLALLDWEIPEMNGPAFAAKCGKGKSNRMSTWCC
jgi:CheY-like chemotaxis protein